MEFGIERFGEVYGWFGGWSGGFEDGGRFRGWSGGLEDGERFGGWWKVWRMVRRFGEVHDGRVGMKEDLEVDGGWRFCWLTLELQD